ncbi:MAG: DnaA regulatory inactivator Hda [Halomonas sp.]|uniref:DnaA regulatory inactivator Hda n=1 Tax=unclassified Halomonas TaxID=2609666 RepID=UPI00023A2E9D|nr:MULTISPECIES: DnaA regulatory inactivator Hda [unclassified Halomonas]AVI63655.1 DnaA regulatory inactivator Hda [Halomonas sp. GFAJ-1]EHK62106.1 regulatory inactivation of DnaA Hda protein [Halomonas sp. GFAJ-1]MBR2515210.1 DnaA regulatory inactivator Hda [Halomonas sp.]MDP3534990.1 DnaA regulatory inactivator Hda [Halomonas sp.]WFE71708.1 DnaA regulatory inactivator Hda [Halomonas sp. M1]
MSRVPAQLPLGVGVRDDATFNNYYVSSANAALVEYFTRQLQPEAEPFLYLWGAPGSGRSHLLQAACHAASDADKRALYLPLADLGHFPPLMLEEIERLDLVAIDDLEYVVGRKRWEEALFHAFNRLRDAGKALIIASSSPPRQLEVVLPDLASRLTWGVTFHLNPLDDAERLGALKLRANVRGMQLPEDVGRYILHRGPRELGELCRALETLDQASLSAKRKLTIPFVKSALNW